MMQSRAWMVVSLLITCLAAAFALSAVFGATKPTIVQQQAAATNSSLSQVLPQAATFEVKERDSLWYGLDGSGAKVGIVVRSGLRGYGGPVPVLAGIDLSGLVVGIKVASAAEGLKETPGLGLKATESRFTRQLLGADSTVALKKNGGAVDAISGATITSRAVVDGVNRSIRKYAAHLSP